MAPKQVPETARLRLREVLKNLAEIPDRILGIPRKPRVPAEQAPPARSRAPQQPYRRCVPDGMPDAVEFSYSDPDQANEDA